MKSKIVIILLVILQLISLNIVFAKSVTLNQNIGTINHPTAEDFSEDPLLPRQKRQSDKRPIARLLYRDGKFLVLGQPKIKS